MADVDELFINMCLTTQADYIEYLLRSMCTLGELIAIPRYCCRRAEEGAGRKVGIG